MLGFRGVGLWVWWFEGVGFRGVGFGGGGGLAYKV